MSQHYTIGIHHLTGNVSLKKGTLLTGHFILKDLSKQYVQIKTSRCIRKQTICICENKDADQLCSNCTADQCHCFCYIDGTNPKFQSSSLLLWLYRPICVGLGRKPKLVHLMIVPDKKAYL